MNILVCGGRSFGDIATLQRRYPLAYRKHPLWERRETEYDFVFRTLDLLAIEVSANYRQDKPWQPSDLKIVAGAASGADTAAVDWAKARGAQWVEYPAEWERYGVRQAGRIRNQQMLDAEHPQMGIAFPGFRGTRDMVRRLKSAGIEVRQIDHKCATQIQEEINITQLLKRG